MKLVPSLAPISAHGPPPGMEQRLGIFSPDLLWRYPSINFPSPTPFSLPMDFKTHLPTTLGGDPRHWSREDVVAFLRWAEYEFDLPPFDLEMFQMNGKALCLLTKADLNERTPGSGDVLHNVLQMLMRDSRTLPSSPLTPHFPLTPSWSFNAPPIDFPTIPFSTAAPVSLNSVTLSPAPSVDSTAGSPRYSDHAVVLTYNTNNYGSSSQSTSGSGSAAGSSGSNQSDSEVEDHLPRPPATPTRSPTPNHSPATPHTPTATPTPTHRHQPVFFPSDQVTSEPNTNGRLLWDFLQQLLNDSLQRYTAYIAWKNREIGVFKIVDPPGLAKLWGIQKNHLSMNYDKMSRALRYYYRVNILRKVQGERHCYQFLRNPSELKSIKNISLLRQQMNNAEQQQQQHQVKSEPVEAEEERPTDLSINNHHFRLSAPSDFEYMRNPSELKIMKNLHTLREQRLANANSSQSETQPHDLSAGAMQLSLNLAAEQLTRPRDLSPRLTDSLPLVKEEGERYMRNPSELKIMKNLHTLREQRLANANSSQSETKPHDLSVWAMQLSLNLAAEQITRPRDLSPRLSDSLPLVKEEGERQAS